MFTDFLNSYTNADEKANRYTKELIAHLENSIRNGQPLYAVHGFCTDGGTAGAMIKHAIPEAAIIPLDYTVLKNPQWIKLLQKLNWVGIVDLEPFNTKTIQWYVDHHQSTVGKEINANKIRFDVDGDSGAWQLYLSSFLSEMPDKIVELAVMTRVTDTAGYVSEPPTTIINDLMDLNITESEGEIGKIQNEQRIWLLDDAWGSVENLKQQLELHNLLAADGFLGLQKLLPRINKLRQFRSEGFKIANEIAIDTDIIIFSFKSDSVDKFVINRRLQKRGAKVVISMSNTPNGFKISFRRNRGLSDDENKNIQLHELAKELNGGGHAGASGGFSESYEYALSTITKWAADHKLTLSSNKLN
ncbi:MAG: hypothetical protein GPJ54_00620 [Candidatus Heimdallarchaeota archaeon]|nr:hypothetical protein [Candidatus Heimdallarchaeota archaeon]